MPENIEKRFFKKERKPVPVSETYKSASEDIERCRDYTEKREKKYKHELKDWVDFNNELIEELGGKKEYAFLKILIDEVGEEIRVNDLYPDFLILPEEVIKNYREAKKFMVRKPYLYEYLKTGIKQIIFHEREHVLEGPAQEAMQKRYDEIRKLKEELSHLKEIREMVRGEERETVEQRIDKIGAILMDIELGLESTEIEAQVELQKIVESGVDEETMINRIAVHQTIITILYDGVEDALTHEAQLEEEENVFFGNYSFLKPKIIKKIVEKYLKFTNELKKEYEKWKKESKKEKTEKE